MKKKILFLIFTFTFILTATVLPVSILAGTTSLSYDTAISILKDKNIRVPKRHCYFKHNGNFYIVYCDNDFSGVRQFDENLYKLKATASPVNFYVYEFKNTNVYSPVNRRVNDDDFPITKGDICYSTYNILKWDSAYNDDTPENVVISKGYNSAFTGGNIGGNTGGSSSQPGINPITPSNTLTSFLTNKNLSGVLNEIVQLLPILIPVLISFIAIRKGLKFVLSNVSSA